MQKVSTLGRAKVSTLGCAKGVQIGLCKRCPHLGQALLISGSIDTHSYSSAAKFYFPSPSPQKSLYLYIHLQKANTIEPLSGSDDKFH